MQDLQERLAALEQELGRLRRQNLRLRWLLLGGLLFAWLPYLLAMQEQTVTFRTVRAQRVEIISPTGDTVMTLAAALFGFRSFPPTYGLAFRNPQDECVASLVSSPSPALFLWSIQEGNLSKPAIRLGADPEGGGSLSICNKEEKLVVIMGVVSDTEPARKLGSVGSGFLYIYDRYANAAVSIGTNYLGGSITLRNPLGGVTFRAP